MQYSPVHPRHCSAVHCIALLCNTVSISVSGQEQLTMQQSAHPTMTPPFPELYSAQCSAVFHCTVQAVLLWLRHNEQAPKVHHKKYHRDIKALLKMQCCAHFCLFVKNTLVGTASYSGSFFCQVQLFPACTLFQEGPPSLKTDCLQKKTQFQLGPLGDGICKHFVPKLYMYHAGDAWVRTRWIRYIIFFLQNFNRFLATHKALCFTSKSLDTKIVLTLVKIIC